MVTVSEVFQSHTRDGRSVLVLARITLGPATRRPHAWWRRVVRRLACRPTSGLFVGVRTSLDGPTVGFPGWWP